MRRFCMASIIDGNDEKCLLRRGVFFVPINGEKRVEQQISYFSRGSSRSTVTGTFIRLGNRIESILYIYSL